MGSMLSPQQLGLFIIKSHLTLESFVNQENENIRRQPIWQMTHPATTPQPTKQNLIKSKLTRKKKEIILSTVISGRLPAGNLLILH